MYIAVGWIWWVLRINIQAGAVSVRWLVNELLQAESWIVGRDVCAAAGCGCWWCLEKVIL